MIRCGHCGGTHPTVAEIRSCSATNPDPAPTQHALSEPELFPSTRPPTSAPPASGPTPEALRVDLSQRPLALLAGPEPLGRSLLIRPGGEIPEAWAAATKVVVANAMHLGHETTETLQAAWSTRTRLVIELTGALPDPAPILDIPWWELAPDMNLAGEREHHLLTANAVDLLDPSNPRFAPLDAAIAAGAGLHDVADIVDAEGQPAWCDGGPLTLFDEQFRVVPVDNLIMGSLVVLGAGEPTAELAPDQLKAVAHSGGGARIIAPAGSGKTRVLTERVRHLVRDRNIHAGAICLVAFNVRAREEMQERTTDLPGLDIRTLNSLALAICNGSGAFAKPRNHRPVKVIDEPQVRRILDDLVTVRRKAMSDPIAAWIEALTSSRLGLRSPAAVEGDFGGDVKDFSRIGPEYVEFLDSRNLVDFDQQILRAIHILTTDPAARRQARRICHQLLVDEFQDLTPAHLVLVRLIAGPKAQVFGVGDDDQTIYGYSGASPEWLINFSELFPGSTNHDLEINYRCPPDVVEAAANLLTHNRRRVTKTIRPKPGRPNERALSQVTVDEPAAALVDQVRYLLDNGARTRDIAVLTRVNATLLAPLVALSEAGIGTTKPIDGSFLDRTGISGALAWLELAVAPSSNFPSAALNTAVRRPPRALHPKAVEFVTSKRSVKELLDLAGWMRDERDSTKVAAFAEHITTVRDIADNGGSTRQVLESVRDDVGLGRALDTKLDASRRAVDRSSHGDDLSALLSIADLHPDPMQFISWLDKRLDDIAHDPGGVRLSTVHRVKGREWPHVIVYEATAGLFPHRLAESDEEERRVFHVALTRGAASVQVISGQPPSRLVPELAEARDTSNDPTPTFEPKPEVAKAAAAKKPRRSMPEASTLEVASTRERLRTWRTTQAKDDAVPAYVIFSDATLHELAEYMPTSDEALLAIKGIGPAKVAKFGTELLAVLHK